MAAVAAALLAVPLVYLVLRTVAAGAPVVLDTLLRPRTWQVTASSLALATAVAASCVAIGVPTGWLLVRAALPARRAWAVLAALPLAVPSYVAAYAWVALFPGVSGFVGAWWVLTLVSHPLVTLPVVAALRGADPAVEEVARSLGNGPWRTFLRVTWPQLRPAAAAGALLVALYVLSDFGAVAIMRFDAFTRVIYAGYRASFDRSTAAVLACVLVALALVLVVLEQRVRARGKRRRLGGGTPRPAVPAALGGARWVALAFLVTVAAASLAVPAASLARELLRGTRVGWSVPELVSAAVATLGVSIVGAVVAMLLAIPLGTLAGRYGGRAVRAVEATAYAGHALPAVVVGLSLVFLTLALVAPLYQTVLTLAFAYAVLFSPKAIGTLRVATAAVPPGMEEVARSLGRGPVAAWQRTTLRLTAPAVAVGSLLVLLAAMKELPATLMLRPTGLDTLATEMWTRTEVADFGAAAPFAATLVLLAAVPSVVLSGELRRARSAVDGVDPAEALR